MNTIKRFFFVFCFSVLGLTNLLAQNITTPKLNDSNKIYGTGMDLQLAPKFSGDVMKYIADSIRYPQEARKKNIEGKVYMSFIIEKDGSISTVKVLRADNTIFINEAERVMYAMPKWRPGRKDGKPVRVKEMIAVNFKL